MWKYGSIHLSAVDTKGVWFGYNKDLLFLLDFSSIKMESAYVKKMKENVSRTAECWKLAGRL